MRTALYSAALMGAALVSAVPSANIKRQGSSGQGSSQTGNIAGDQFNENTQPFPLEDGFPNPNSQQLINIERNAHGTLSNATSPPNAPPLSNDTITSLQLIATTELLESDFWENFLLNVTLKLPGFDNFTSEEDFNFLVDILIQIVGIEELHALNANKGLESQGQPPIQPAKYVFPVNNLEDAFNVANQLTDGVLSTLQDVIRRLADDGDHGLINGVVAVVGNEGEQDGFIRTQQHRNPAAQPFLTGGDRRFAFSVLENNFIVPGSDHNKIDLPVFLPLNVDTTNIAPEDQTLTFSIPLNTIPGNADVSSSSSSSGPGPAASGHSRRARRHAARWEAGSASSTSSSYGPGSTGSSYGSGSQGSGSGSQGSGSSSGNGAYYNGGKYGSDYSSYDWSSTNLAYISEQNVPIVVPLQNIQIQADQITFEAFFPGHTNFLDAFTIAAVVDSAGPFTSPVDVANHTIAGPGFIEATD